MSPDAWTATATRQRETRGTPQESDHMKPNTRKYKK